MFGYAHVPTFKKHQRKIDEAVLPDSLERHDQSEAIAEALVEAGYVRIGLDHFALPGDAWPPRYAREGCAGISRATRRMPAISLIGFGASAIGRLPQGYVQNEVGDPRLFAAIAAGRLATVKGYALTDDDRLRADIIERIMCDFGVDLDAVCARHGSAPKPMLRSSRPPAGS